MAAKSFRQLGRQAEEEADPAHLRVLEAEQWGGAGAAGSRRGSFAASSSISTPPSALAMTVTAPAAAVEDQRRGSTPGDLGGRGDQHRPHRDPLDLQADDLAGAAAGLVRGGRQLHAAGLATTADEHLRLDHDHLARRSAPRPPAPPPRSVAISPGETGTPWRARISFASVFLELHARQLLTGAMVTRVGPPTRAYTCRPYRRRCDRRAPEHRRP